jgi:hypothetical protein
MTHDENNELSHVQNTRARILRRAVGSAMSLKLSEGFVKDCYHGKGGDGSIVQVMDISMKGDFWLYVEFVRV